MHQTLKRGDPVMIARTSRVAARAAFTLIEVLAVLMIVVIMAGIGGVMYMRYLEGARKDRVKIDVKMLEEAVQIYHMKYGSPPASLVALTQPMPDGTKAVLEPSALLDPWGHEYQYAAQGSHHLGTDKPDIWSQGDGSDPTSVIGNWSPGQ
jgi:general secretion pathway protein G